MPAAQYRYPNSSCSQSTCNPLNMPMAHRDKYICYLEKEMHSQNLNLENIPIYNLVEILKILMNTSVEILKLHSPLEHLQPTNYAYGTL